MRRYHFYTKAKDYRPLKLLPEGYKWWLTGFAGVRCDSWIIVCYLPDDAQLTDYWDDAHGIDVVNDVKEMDSCSCWETQEGTRNSPTNFQKFMEVFGFKPNQLYKMTVDWWYSPYRKPDVDGDND